MRHKKISNEPMIVAEAVRQYNAKSPALPSGLQNLDEILGYGRISSERDARKAVELGIPKEAVLSIVKYITRRRIADPALVSELVPRATLARKSLLGESHGERVMRMARIISLAEEVFESRDKAVQFMLRPHPMLEGKTPWAAALSESGGRQVEEILWKLFYGVAA